MAKQDRSPDGPSPDDDPSPGLDSSFDVDLSLETWAVATFDVVAFGLVLVLFGHASGVLAEVLPDLGTLPGIAVFGYLWALVLAATRTVLPDGGLEELRTESGAPGVVSHGFTAGAMSGSGFVLGVVLVGFLPLVVQRALSPVGLLLLGSAGAAIGGAVGGVVGVLFAMLDAAIFGIADRIVPEP